MKGRWRFFYPIVCPIKGVECSGFDTKNVLALCILSLSPTWLGSLIRSPSVLPERLTCTLGPWVERHCELLEYGLLRIPSLSLRRFWAYLMESPLEVDFLRSYDFQSNTPGAPATEAQCHAFNLACRNCMFRRSDA